MPDLRFDGLVESSPGRKGLAARRPACLLSRRAKVVVKLIPAGSITGDPGTDRRGTARGRGARDHRAAGGYGRGSLNGRHERRQAAIMTCPGRTAPHRPFLVHNAGNVSPRGSRMKEMTTTTSNTWSRSTCRGAFQSWPGVPSDVRYAGGYGRIGAHSRLSEGYLRQRRGGELRGWAKAAP